MRPLPATMLTLRPTTSGQRNRHDMIEAARMAAEATSESVREDKESLDARVRVLQMREKHLQVRLLLALRPLLLPNTSSS